MKNEYQLVKLEEVIKYFYKGFEFKEKPLGWEWFLDPNKGEVIFKFIMEDKEVNKK